MIGTRMPSRTPRRPKRASLVQGELLMEEAAATMEVGVGDALTEEEAMTNAGTGDVSFSWMISLNYMYSLAINVCQEVCRSQAL